MDAVFGNGVGGRLVGVRDGSFVGVVVVVVGTGVGEEVGLG